MRKLKLDWNGRIVIKDKEEKITLFDLYDSVEPRLKKKSIKDFFKSRAFIGIRELILYNYTKGRVNMYECYILKSSTGKFCFYHKKIVHLSVL